MNDARYLKSIIRRRMRNTGESYDDAKRGVLAALGDIAKDQATSLDQTWIEPWIRAEDLDENNRIINESLGS